MNSSNNNSVSNFELRKKLKAMVMQAQQNEAKLHKLQQQELMFISAEGLPELIDNILQQYRDAYKLDYVSLLLIDSDYEIRHVIEFMSPGLLKLPTLIFADNHTQFENVVISHAEETNETRSLNFQKTLFPDFRAEPYLGKCTGACKDTLFPSIYKQPGSVAVLPLIRNHKLIGALNLASYEPERFIKGTGTDLVKRLSALLAVCIENAINNEKLKLLGLSDALTGIHNRRYFMQRLDEEVGRSLRQKLPLSCLFIDIDHFKAFNDTYGHSVGDQVLRYVSGILKKQMRLDDVLARYGGEEFAVLLSNTDTELAQEIAERIRHSIDEAKLKVDSVAEVLSVTVSIGCTTMHNANSYNVALLGETLLNVSDQALYVSKDSGRNCVNVADFNAAVMAQVIN